MNLSEILTSLHINYYFLLKKVSKKHEITNSQALCILSISSNGVSQTELSRRLSIDLSTLSRNLDKLIYRGLIIKLLDSKDNRSYIIKLSNSGDVLYECLIKDLNGEFSFILNNISIDDHDSILNYISIINWEFEKLKNANEL